ncbi:hypothetical protein A167_00981 [Alcanivorax sp. S71-1-4]|uniref:DUF2271 domain-containing protein n=1 Tax=Alcanivorax sp. S71-1-4 TaxID=1177159 RepID=UPI001359B147|nr:DUF2271 domain-containing protein [Alcanivorax sp. S71-1-4]KAF0810300.1 hypothetical protein A167_00981 [Alcanivorax sp. S71-1-4]
MRTLVSAALLLATASAGAAELSVSVDIPRLNVAEYHRPYVAIWLEPEQGAPTTLAVWYDIKLRDSEGEKWLKDMRQWWRRDGRGLSMPVDGVSGATRAVGTHTVSFQSGQAPLGELAPGNYTLLVEAAREVGGREVLSIPFTWPVTGAFSESVTGDTELGGVRLDITP